MSDEQDFEYPPHWAPPGTEPPYRPNYAPPLRSGLGFTGDEPLEDKGADYPAHWKLGR